MRKVNAAHRTFIIAGIVLLALSAGMLGMQLWLRNKIAAMVEDAPFDIRGRSYDVEVGKVRLSLGDRSLRLNDITIEPADETVSREGPAAELRITVEEILLDDVVYKRGRKGAKPTVSVNSVKILSPRVSYSGVPAPDAGGEKKKFSLYDIPQGLTGILDRLSVVLFEIKDAYLTYGHWTHGNKETWTVEGFYMTLGGVELDPAEAAGDDRALLFSRYLTADIFNVSRVYKSGSMTMNIERIALDSNNGTVTVGGFRMTPRYPKASYAAKVSDHSDWTRVEFTDLKAYGLDMVKLQNEGIIAADSVLSAKGSIESYKNRQVVQAPRVKPLLFEPVQNLSLGIDVPYVRVDDLYARYDELAENGSEPGAICFRNIRAVAHGLTNRPSEQGQSYMIEADGLMMGWAPIHLLAQMPAGPGSDYFVIRSEVKSFELSLLNDMISPLSNVEIEAGYSRGFSTVVSGNSVKATAQTEFTYDGLEVALLKRKDHSKKEVLSFLANELAVRHTNTEAAGQRKGEGSYQRDANRSHFNYIWKTIYQSVKPIIMN